VVPAKGLLVGDVKHLEEQSEVLDVVRVVVVVDGEPVGGVRLRVDVPDLPLGPSARDEDGGGEGPRPLRRDEPQVVVPVKVGVLELVEVLDVVEAELVEVLLDVLGEEVGDVALVDAAVPVGGDQVVRLADPEQPPEAERDLLLPALARERSARLAAIRGGGSQGRVPTAASSPS
jgi:hypothetical protein